MSRPGRNSTHISCGRQRRGPRPVHSCTPHRGAATALRGTRLTEPPALAQVAAERGQPLHLAAVSTHSAVTSRSRAWAIQIERFDDRAVDGVGVRMAEAVDERAVDLERVHREPAQPGQAGVAGAEVVEREPDTRRTQRRQAAVPRTRRRTTASSVISSCSCHGGETGSERITAMTSADPARLAPAGPGETFTLTYGARCAQLAPPGGRPAGRPRSSTQRPSGTIAPLRSATSTNRPGPSSPLLGMLPAHQRLGARTRPSASARAVGRRSRTRRRSTPPHMPANSASRAARPRRGRVETTRRPPSLRLGPRQRHVRGPPAAPRAAVARLASATPMLAETARSRPPPGTAGQRARRPVGDAADGADVLGVSDERPRTRRRRCG